ncbi:MAG: ABC transporter substrate-binding protein [Oscillospiraceae bacterium]|nr:ABC transporter substrate-binding protein [Oscillospiraceae bacterium]
MKKLVAMLLCIAMVLGLAACGGSASTAASTAPAADPAAPAAEGEAAPAAPAAPAADGEAAPAEEDLGPHVFVYGTDANSTTFDPASDLQTNSGSFLIYCVGETLWTVDTEGNITYVLADNVDYTEEALTITLKEGITFSNGDAFDAEDVLFTLNHAASMPRTASMYACMNLEAATVEGNVITIPMNYYDAALIDLLGNCNNMMLDSEVCGVEGYGYDWLIGTGPYVLSEWNESQNYIITRNENYWGEAPYYDEFDVYFYSEESTRYADFQSGKLDGIYLTEATYINNLSNGAVTGASLYTAKENSVYGFEMAWNSDSRATFSDINVRKAFAHCLDVKSMVEALGEGVYTVATDIVGENSWVYENKGIYEYDVEAAKEYMAKAGYSPSNPLTVGVYAEGTAWNSAMFEAAQSYCAEIGINLDLSGVADFATILPVLLSGGQDMGFGQGSNGSGLDPANLLQQFGPASDNVLIRTCATDYPELAEKFTKGASSTDQAEREKLYKELIDGIYDNYLFIPVCQGTKNYGVLDTHPSAANAINPVSCWLDPKLLTD